MHVVEALVDLGQSAVVSDVLVDLDFALKVICTDVESCTVDIVVIMHTLNQTRNFSATLHATESGSAPCTTSDQLEWTSRDLLTSSRDADDGADTPTLVACLKSRTHDVNLQTHIVSTYFIHTNGENKTDVTGAVESVVKASVGYFDEVVLDFLALRELGRVNEVGCAKLAGPRLLAGVGVDSDDT